MKNIFKIFTILIFGLSFTLGYSQDTQKDIKNDKDLFTVKVDGLGCPFCAFGLEKKFKEWEGIDDIKIEMETGIFTFSFPAYKALELEQVEQQVDAAGYTAVTAQVSRNDGMTEELSPKSQAVSEDRELTDATMLVSGNCGMCKNRIEKSALKIEGVVEATWDVETQILALKYVEAITSKDKIAAGFAASGHDTKTHEAEFAIYKDLPECCKYERSEK